TIQGQVRAGLGAPLHGLSPPLGLAGGDHQHRRPHRRGLVLRPLSPPEIDMRRVLVPLLPLLILLSPRVSAAKSLPPSEEAPREEQIPVPLFGKLPVYRPDPVEKARGLVLLVSGDGGWKLGVVGMARRIAGSAVVVGIPMTTWRKMAELHP